MIHTVYKMPGIGVYVIEIDGEGDDYLYLTNKTSDVTQKTPWTIVKTKKSIYEHNKKDLVEFCEIEIDEGNVTKALLTDQLTVFI